MDDRKPTGKPEQPPQHQARTPGVEGQMEPPPEAMDEHYRPGGKLEGKVAIVTGGDSGIGRAVSIAFAREGADVAVVYLDEHEDAQKTKADVEKAGRRCELISGDLKDEHFCRMVVDQAVGTFGKLDILVNNAGEHEAQDSLLDISAEQLEWTFRTNVFSMFYLTKAALPHLEEGAAIVNCASVTAYKGHPVLLDYSASKGAVVTFTRSLAINLASKGIRVNAVAPGPIWTPLIPSTFTEDKVSEFGGNTPLGRPGQPVEVATSFVFLASDDASYMTGQVLHPNGGRVVNG